MIKQGNSELPLLPIQQGLPFTNLGLAVVSIQTGGHNNFGFLFFWTTRSTCKRSGTYTASEHNTHLTTTSNYTTSTNTSSNTTRSHSYSVTLSSGSNQHTGFHVPAINQNQRNSLFANGPQKPIPWKLDI